MADEKEKKLKLHLGLEIKNVCPCGKSVEVYERQQLVRDPDENVWKRMCSVCIGRDRTYTAISSTEAFVR